MDKTKVDDMATLCDVPVESQTVDKPVEDHKYNDVSNTYFRKYGTIRQRLCTLLSTVLFMVASSFIIYSMLIRKETFEGACPGHRANSSCSSACIEVFKEYHKTNQPFDISMIAECNGCTSIEYTSAAEEVLPWMIFGLIHIVFVWLQCLFLIWGDLSSMLFFSLMFILLEGFIGFPFGMVSGIFSSYHRACATENAVYAIWMFGSLAYPWLIISAIVTICVPVGLVSSLLYILYRFVLP